MFRRRGRGEPEPPQPVDPHAALRSWATTLGPRWGTPVLDSLATRERFLAVLAQAPAGPSQERLAGLGATVDEAVRRVADAAWRASNAEATADGLDPGAASEELKEARRQLDRSLGTGVDTTAAEQRVRSLADRHRAINDALNLAEEAGTRLAELNVQLQTAVARAATIVLRTAQDDRIEDLDRELTDVVNGLTALDDALERLG